MAAVKVTQEWFGEQVKAAAEKLASKSAYEIGLWVMSQAKELAPVSTGRLKGSIMVASSSQSVAPEQGFIVSDDFDKLFSKLQNYEDVKPIQPPNNPFEVFVGSSVEYAPYMEYGTVKADAQPFLRPALDIARGRALQIVEHNGRQAFAKYINK